MFSYILVDDEILIRKGIINKIKKLNLSLYCAYEAENGEDALKYLEKNTIDFVITDMDMPKVDGVEFLTYLNEHYTNIPILVISGYKKFEYLQKSVQANVIDYVLKPFSKEDLFKPLKKIINKIKINHIESTEIIKNSILGHYTEKSIIEIDKIIDQIANPILLLIYGKLNNNILKATDYLFELSDTNNLYFSITEKNTFLKYKAAFRKNLVSFYDGPIESDKLNIYYSYCINGLNSRKFNDPHIVSSEEKVRKKQKRYLNSQTKIQYFIEAGEYQKLQKTLPTILSEELIDADESLMTLKTVLIYTLQNTKAFLNNYFDLSSSYTIPKLIDELYNSYFSFQDVVSYITIILTNISESMSSEQLYSSKDIVENVKQYIDLHYSDPINLDFLSDIFYINPSYLSTLFKAQVGVSFSKYLTTVRVNNSKRLLNDTKMSIEDIARKVGYDNTKYFFRVFKKNVNNTPEEYRAKNDKIH